MRSDVFLDTNVFIYAFEFRESNSATVMGMLNKGEIRGIISPRVIKEVTKYFERDYTNAVAQQLRTFLLKVCHVIAPDDKAMTNYRGQIKEKDLEQLVVVKSLKLRYIISYDRDFKAFPEYITPKNFVQLMRKHPRPSEY